MNDTLARHAEQLAYWNGDGGGAWVAEQARTDAVLAPVADALIAHAAPVAGETVLDIGCGCGATTLLLAPRVARVIALDVSMPMLAVARRRAAGLANIAFVDADAATYATPTQCDLLFSRFGVMFFGDPVAALANLRRSARPGARLVFACWRAIGENPWMQVPLHAAYQHIPRLPKPEPNAPGPFAFADPDWVTSVLTGAGWPSPSFTKLDVMLDIAAGGGLEAAVHQATHIGAASRALREAPEEARPAAIDAIRAALAPHEKDGRVALAGGIWLVTAIA